MDEHTPEPQEPTADATEYEAPSVEDLEGAYGPAITAAGGVKPSTS